MDDLRGLHRLWGHAPPGSGILFVPSKGPSGTIGGTPTATAFTLSALPNGGAVGINQMANAGAGVGYTIRVYGKTAGLTQERQIINNTAGTTPTITPSAALTFIPTTSDTYEILSGSIMLLSSGTTAAGYWKAYDILTGTVSANLRHRQPLGHHRHRLLRGGAG